MKYEYVALTWQTHRSGADPVFGDDMRELLDERWEEVCRASFEPSRTGGACIMRRPKDEPRMWTEKEIRDLMQEVECRRDTRLSGEVNHCLVHPSSALVGRVGVHVERESNDPNRLVMTTSGKRVPAYTLADRPTGNYVDPAF